MSISESPAGLAELLGAFPASAMTLRAARRLARSVARHEAATPDHLLILADRFGAAAQESRLASTPRTAAACEELAAGLDHLAGTMRAFAPVLADLPA